jgi:hypothetical protein
MATDYDAIGFDAEHIIQYNEEELCGLIFKLFSQDLHVQFGYPAFYADVSQFSG